MLISTKGRYALRILVDIAEHQTEGYLPLKYAGWDGSPHLDATGYVAWAEVIRTHYA